MHWPIARHCMIQIGIGTSVLIGLLDVRDLWHAQALTLSQAAIEAGAGVAVFDCALAEAISTMARRIHEQRRVEDLNLLLDRVVNEYPAKDILWLLPAFHCCTRKSSRWCEPRLESSTSTMHSSLCPVVNARFLIWQVLTRTLTGCPGYTGLRNRGTCPNYHSSRAAVSNRVEHWGSVQAQKAHRLDRS
jgi:hypothetical protein